MSSAEPLTATRIAAELHARPIRPGAWMATCPRCDYPGGFKVTDRDGRALFHCFAQCSQDEVLGELRQRGLWTGPAADILPSSLRPKRQHVDAQRRRQKMKRYATALWSAAQPVGCGELSVATLYLKARGLAGVTPPRWRYLPAVPLPDQAGEWSRRTAIATAPALLTRFLPPGAERGGGLHVTFLAPDASNLRSPAGRNWRITVGPPIGARIDLGSVRSAPRSSETADAGAVASGASSLQIPRVLVMGEGVETTLAGSQTVLEALAIAGIDALVLRQASIVAGNLRAPPIPPGVADLIVLLVDADLAGEAAAADGLVALRAAGQPAMLLATPADNRIAGEDWNDVRRNRPQAGVDAAGAVVILLQEVAPVGL